MNVVNLVARLTRDPEKKTFDGGAVKATTGVAVDRYVKGAENDKETSFFELQAWGKTAETLCQHVKKGTAIGITGHLVQERWVNQTNQKEQSKVVIVMDRLHFLPANKKKEEESSSSSSSTSSDLNSIFPTDDEIPF